MVLFSKGRRQEQLARLCLQLDQKKDPNGHLQMPGTRMISCPNEILRSYFANTRSPACPVGYSQEETIKKIWNNKYK